MQKHGLTPDQKLRKAIYDGLKVREENPKAVTILGSDFALDETSDIRRLLKWKHIEVKELPECNSWKSYQELADSKNIHSVLSAWKIWSGMSGRTT